MTAQLSVTGLNVRLETDAGRVLPVRDLSFDIEPGEILALVGESGCGKSMTALALMGLTPPIAQRSGSIILGGRDISTMSDRAMQDVRGKELSMIFQEPATSLNPAFTVGFQVAEVVRRHQGLGRRAARERAIELLRLVGIPAAARRAKEHPHQMSGGMRQRVMIAMAVACNPRVLIADEPTTALDVTIQAQILDVLREMRDNLGTSIILITHDLGVVADLADRMIVMYAGSKIESGPVDDVFQNPKHPYTRGLLGAVPRPDLGRTEHDARLSEIPGVVPVIRAEPTACVFAGRCGQADADCRAAMPSITLHGGHDVACFHPGVRPRRGAEVVWR